MLMAGIYGLASNNTPHIPDGVVKIGAVWFLRALFIGNILMELVNHYNGVLKWIVAFILLIVASIQTSSYCVPIRLNYGCAFLIWLMIGYQYDKTYKSSSKCDSWFLFLESKSFFILCGILWILIILLEGITGNMYSLPSVGYPLYGLELVGAFCGIMTIMFLSKIISGSSLRLTNIFSYLGRISLWILCIHALSLELLKFASDGSISKSIFISITRFIIDILFAIVIREFYFLIKRISLKTSK